jgi:hypothetical protein
MPTILTKCLFCIDNDMYSSLVNLIRVVSEYDLGRESNR